MRTRFLMAFLLVLLPPAAFAQANDNAPSKLASANRLSQDKPQSESWTFIDPGANFKSYHSVFVDNTAVYSGPEADFGKISKPDRVKYAADFTSEIRAELGKEFTLVNSPAAGVLRVRFTIVQLSETVGGVATATRVLPVGLATSALKSLAGKPGTMSGSMLAAVEFYDGKSNKLVAAALRRRSPDALNIPSTISTEQTVKAIAREFGRRISDAMKDAGVQGH